MEHHDGETIEDSRKLFREVNERVRAINLTYAHTARLSDFVCECSDPECTERLTLSIEQFDAVREHAGRFVVQWGHGTSAERTVELHEGFAVVERLDEHMLVEPKAAA